MSLFIKKKRKFLNKKTDLFTESRKQILVETIKWFYYLEVNLCMNRHNISDAEIDK